MLKKVSFSIVAALLVFYIDTTNAQSEWLSTPESVSAFRSQVETLKPAESKFEVNSIQDMSVDLGDRKIDIRVYDPGLPGPTQTLIYVHGACWVAGSLDSHDEISRYLAIESGSKVIAIDYRLAPEFKYPAAHDDVFDTVQWLWDNADELGIDKNKFAISGESAGAYFAAATALRAIETENSPQFAFQLLVYAAIDGGGAAWPECKNQYFENEDQQRSNYGSPLWADNLSGLPPTFNIFGQYEVSRVEEELWMRKLAEQGVNVQSYMIKNVGHDVGNWGTVTGDLAAHKKAVDYIEAGFKLPK